MRLSRNRSLRWVGNQTNYSDSAIHHFEQGRLDLKPETIMQLLAVYNYSFEEFKMYVNGKPLPVISIKDECVRLIHRLDESKLRAVHAFLTTFVG